MDRIYRLIIRAPLHVGSTGVGSEGTLAYMPSDSLFAAIVSTWATLEPESLEAWLAPFSQGKPPFLLSSAFPYAGDVRLFPAPVFEPPLSGELRRELGKKLKRLSHVSEGILTGWLKGNDLENELEHKGVSNFIQSGRAWVTTGERSQIATAIGLPAEEPDALLIWREQVAPHVTVGRINNTPNLHHSGRVTFSKGCGLWLGLRGPDEWSERVERALRVMADSGMGGLRSTGHGAFKFQPWPSKNTFAAPEEDGYGFLLSRTAPAATQMQSLIDAGTSYRLATIGGWCGNEEGMPRKRRRVRLLAEGSVVRWTSNPFGQLVDVNPVSAGDTLAHPVYRNGFGLAIRVEKAALEAKP